MNSTLILSISAAAALGAVSSAHGALIHATITADNHYAVYGVSGGSIFKVGGNEIGHSGSPGTYNWSRPETWSFITENTLYIAAWSDDAVAQGLLAQLTADGLPLHSGDARWEVFTTGVDLDTGAPHPSAGTITGFVNTANTGGLWASPFIGGNNGIAPWGTVPGITSDARWMWANVAGDANPLIGGSAAGEMLIFRVAVPTPGAAAMAGVALMMGLRMRRR